MVKAEVNSTIEIAGNRIKPGSRQSFDIPLPSFYTHGSASMPVHVTHGRKPGPVLLVCAAVHGDEINGVEIVRRLLTRRSLNRLSGTLIAIPVVNVFGFVSKSRYLPDRRDLNRSFPGSEAGSMASRLANVLMTKIIPHCTHIIDLHTGAVMRENLPQIRAKLSDEPEIESLARAFGVPVILDANLLEGSFREAAHGLGIPMVLYEAGEALRFDEVAIRAGVEGVLRVLTMLKMRPTPKRHREADTVVANMSRWMRAPQSGIMRTLVGTGQYVAEGDVLAYINDPLGDNICEITSSLNGIIIGKTNLPLVFAGEAVFNIAAFEKARTVSNHIEAYHEELALNGDQHDGEEPPLD